MYTIASAGFMRSVWPLQALDALCRLMSTALESLCFQLPSQAHVNGLGRLMLKNYVVEVAHFTMWWISFQVHATFASKNKQKTCMISYRKAGDACGMNLCSAIETIRERESLLTLPCQPWNLTWSKAWRRSGMSLASP